MAGCRHPDIQRFGEMRCCLSCGEAIFENTSEPEAKAANSSSSEYCYKPLRHTRGDEIRLIILYAGKPAEDLVCDIIVVNLTDRPAFEAVSYTWADANGDLSKNLKITCQGKSIPITKNCDAALRRLRLQSRSRRLWIDAICINQSDTIEKNHQVRLMTKIYTKASQVLAYLGVEHDRVTVGMQRIVEYLKDETSVTKYELITRDHLDSLFELNYFDRVWVLQEIGLSQLVTLIVGACEVRWTGSAISKMLKLSSAFGIQAPSILRWSPASRPKEERDIPAVLSRGRNCSATDPRDKVYALLGLMHPEFSLQFGIDYSISPAEVFTKVAIHCINNGRFNILQHVHYTKNSIDLTLLWIPTWVPIWDLKDQFDPPPVHFSQENKDTLATSWHAFHLQPGAWLHHELPRDIIVKEVITWVHAILGAPIDRISLSTLVWRRYVKRWTETHHDVSRGTLTFPEIDHVAHQISARLNHSFSYLISEREVWSMDGRSEASSAAFQLPCLKLRAQRLDRITRNLGIVSDARSFHIPRMTWQVLGSQYCEECFGVSCFSEVAVEQARQKLNFDFRTYGAGKMAFSTDLSVGLTRGRAIPGDSIWALYGADVPFVLREVDDHYYLIGDCYLYKAGKPFPCKHCG